MISFFRGFFFLSNFHCTIFLMDECIRSEMVGETMNIRIIPEMLWSSMDADAIVFDLFALEKLTNLNYGGSATLFRVYLKLEKRSPYLRVNR